MGHYSPMEGERIVRAVRAAVELYVGAHNFKRSLVDHQLSDLTDRQGVSVSIEHYPTRTPRGSHCVVRHPAPLHRELIDCAIAAVDNKEHVPLSHMEFEHIVVEVAILSEMEQLPSSVSAALRHVRHGIDGLYVEYGFHNAIMLPQEWDRGSSGEKHISKLFERAGLAEHHRKLGNAKLYRFTAQVFRERSPRGSVEEMHLG